MINKKSVLVSVNFLVEVSEKELENENENGELFKLENHLSEAHENIDSPLPIDWNSTQSLILDTKTMNCGLCKSCGCWTTDKESPESIGQLNNGAVVDNKLLCDECLPSIHPWSF